MNILLIDTPDQFILDLQVVLIKTIGCNFIMAKSAADAVKEIKAQNEIVLIIAKDKIGNEKTQEILQSLNLSIPIIYRKTSSTTVVPYILDEKSLETNIIMISNLLKDKITENKKSNMAYIPVKASQFLNIDKSQLACDVYIKIKKTGKPDQYLKRLHANNHFSREEVEKYIKAGLEEFHIPEDQYADFINMISIEIINALKNSKFEGLDKFTLTSCAFETTMERLKFFGLVDDVTIHLANENIKAITKSIEKHDALSNFLKHLKSQSTSYAFLQCFLIALLSEKLAKFFEWGSPQARDKLIYLAYFHNISLPNLNWYELNSKSDLEKSTLSPSDKEKILHHAELSSELINKFKDVPFGLAQLVKEHHGSKAGVGFPENLSISISPMTMMFIVMVDFTGLFIRKNVENVKDLDAFFPDLEKKYNKLTYAQTINSLKSILINNQLKQDKL
jgi:hypothetical protein